jgi:chorismate synthase
MGSNSFGHLFRITTWGESHGKAIGVVIDGCPAGLPITEEEINKELSRRAGGKSPYTTPRAEKDRVEILSGTFQGKTTGAPISLIIYNQDTDSSKYEPIKDLMRPGHANFTYLNKYGIFDYRGGGRSSARETACRVAAGAIAKKLLAHFHIHITAYIYAIGSVTISSFDPNALANSTLFCPDPQAEAEMIQILDTAQDDHDSVGGIIECTTTNLPIGLGDPIYEKLEANLAKGMLSIPATKGFEIGEGFHASHMRGSQHNDTFTKNSSGQMTPTTNHAGGTLGGITTGLPLIFRVAFKPTSSINQPQSTVSTSGESRTFRLPEGSRHDPCVAFRAVPVIEAMAALTLADALLMEKTTSLHFWE